MRKIIFLLVAAGLVLASCAKEEVDGTVTQDTYAGEWIVVSGTCTEFTDIMALASAVTVTVPSSVWNMAFEDEVQIIISNSAANVADEIIIETSWPPIPEPYWAEYDEEEGYDTPISIRGKFKLTGSPAGFSGNAKSENILSASGFSASEYYAFDEDGFYSMQQLIDWGYTAKYCYDNGYDWECLQLYTGFELLDSKITPNGATTKGGYTADAFTMKVKMYIDYVIIEPYETSTDEYAFRIQASSRQPGAHSLSYTLEGHRKTGFAND